MKKRLDALTRIGRFQALMYDLGRSRLYSLERQQAGLTDDLKAVFQTLESDELACGPQAGLAARHIRALQRKLDQLVRDCDAARLSALASSLTVISGALVARASGSAIAALCPIGPSQAIRLPKPWGRNAMAPSAKTT